MEDQLVPSLPVAVSESDWNNSKAAQDVSCELSDYLVNVFLQSYNLFEDQLREVFLIRHGDYNKPPGEGKLTPFGFEQAEITGQCSETNTIEISRSQYCLLVLLNIKKSYGYYRYHWQVHGCQN